ncbi:MAG: multifunctional CCA addition/repair protein [Gammaproteobacteria bacterium]
MEIYLVGGAVRDELLGLPVRERDWVVVGATPEAMLEKGYRPVGADFPVFLHPETREEYALARTERKTAPGYRGFAVHSDPGVTLEEDLQRRDLTINAMARDERGRLIDPYGGERDLEARLLRHVSPAFKEDPVRILRVARFAARFSPLGFSVAPETLALMREMVENGEVDALVPERVWAELSRALTESHPRPFFEVLRDCGALARILPEIDRLFGVPQPVQHHPEVDCGLHSLMVLEQAARLSDSPEVRFAALTHDLGKADTPAKILPSHRGHERRTLKRLAALCDRLRVPRRYRELADLAARFHSHCHRLAELRPSTILDTLEKLDAFRRPERFEAFLLVCEADSRGRLGMEERDYPQRRRFREAQAAAAAIDPRPFVAEGLKGAAVAEALRKARLKAIRQVRDGWRRDR